MTYSPSGHTCSKEMYTHLFICRFCSLLAFVPHIVKIYAVVSKEGGYNLKAPRSIVGDKTPEGQCMYSSISRVVSPLFSTHFCKQWSQDALLLMPTVSRRCFSLQSASWQQNLLESLDATQLCALPHLLLHVYFIIISISLVQWRTRRLCVRCLGLLASQASTLSIPRTYAEPCLSLLPSRHVCKTAASVYLMLLAAYRGYSD